MHISYTSNQLFLDRLIAGAARGWVPWVGSVGGFRGWVPWVGSGWIPTNNAQQLLVVVRPIYDPSQGRFLLKGFMTPEFNQEAAWLFVAFSRFIVCRHPVRIGCDFQGASSWLGADRRIICLHRIQRRIREPQILHGRLWLHGICW